MSRSCNKEQLLVFIVRQSITLTHAILSLTSGPGSHGTSSLTYTVLRKRSAKSALGPQCGLFVKYSPDLVRIQAKKSGFLGFP